MTLTFTGIGLVAGLMACGGDMPPDDRDAATTPDGSFPVDAGIDGGSPVADSGTDGGTVAVDATIDAQPPMDATSDLDATALHLRSGHRAHERHDVPLRHDDRRLPDAHGRTLHPDGDVLLPMIR